MPKCVLLDTHLCATLPGYYKPCCQYTKYADIYQDVTLSEMSHKEYSQTPQFQQIKKDMETGWHKGCEKCRLDETQNGIQSLRQLSNENFKSDLGIQFVEISLSNNCNLSCKMCNTDSSSKWSNLYKTNPDLQHYFRDNNQEISIERVFNGLDLSNLKVIKYLGGEPFITPQTKELFNFLEDQNIINNVQLTTNTNCTFFPHKWIKQLLKFKNVLIGLSLDGFKKSCEYSRTGSNWDELTKNVKYWAILQKRHPKFNIQFSTTVNALTVHDYTNFINYANEVGLGYTPYVVHQPAYLKLEVLPPEYVNSIKDENNKQFLDNVVYDPELFEKFKKFIEITDRAQNINIRNYLPELAKYLDK